MDEQERLENEAQNLKDEIKHLQKEQILGKLEDDAIIKEKRNELFKTLTSLELCKLNEKQTISKRR